MPADGAVRESGDVFIIYVNLVFYFFAEPAEPAAKNDGCFGEFSVYFGTDKICNFFNLV